MLGYLYSTKLLNLILNFGFVNPTHFQDELTSRLVKITHSIGYKYKNKFKKTLYIFIIYRQINISISFLKIFGCTTLIIAVTMKYYKISQNKFLGLSIERKYRCQKGYSLFKR